MLSVVHFSVNSHPTKPNGKKVNKDEVRSFRNFF